MIAHGSVQGFGAEDLDAPASVNNRLRLDGAWLDAVDYVALGDWHGLKQVSAKAWYSGTLEPDRFPGRRTTKPARRCRWSCAAVSPQLQPLATGGLGWHPLRFSFQADSDLDRLEEQLEGCWAAAPVPTFCCSRFRAA